MKIFIATKPSWEANNGSGYPISAHNTWEKAAVAVTKILPDNWKGDPGYWIYEMELEEEK